jgi:hypothetical protein
MPTISVEFAADVKATADKLWDILTDVDSWPQWQGTHFVKSSEHGRIKEGSIFTAELGGLKWDLKVTKAERPYKIVWGGKRLGIKAVHEWAFNEKDGKTIVTTRESMTGWILFLTSPKVRKILSSTDEKWLADLKIKAEST